MPDSVTKEVHYNLYYIFKEDQEKNQLQKSDALILWTNILKQLSKRSKKGLFK